MTAESLVATPRTVLAPPQTYNLPMELSRHVWRMSCRLDEQRQSGASESALMEVAWELFLEIDDARCFALLDRTLARRGAGPNAAGYGRKSYSLPMDLRTRVQRRVNELKSVADEKKLERPTLWLLAEVAQINLVELTPADLDAACDRFHVARKRT